MNRNSLALRLVASHFSNPIRILTCLSEARMALERQREQQRKRQKSAVIVVSPKTARSADEDTVWDFHEIVGLETGRCLCLERATVRAFCFSFLYCGSSS